MTDKNMQLEQMDTSSMVVSAVIIAVIGVFASIANMAIIGLFFNAKFSFADNNHLTITMFVLFMLGGIAFVLGEIIVFSYNYRVKMVALNNCCKAYIGGAVLFIILILILPNVVPVITWWDGVAFLLIQIFSCGAAVLCILSGVLGVILWKLFRINKQRLKS